MIIALGHLFESARYRARARLVGLGCLELRVVGERIAVFWVAQCFSTAVRAGLLDGLQPLR
jgi:hypothetical protein